MTLAEQIKALEIAQFQGTQFHCLLPLARSEGRFKGFLERAGTPLARLHLRGLRLGRILMRA
jgi:hypothetical protein